MGASSPIRLALCITELDLGGAERAFTELATRLDRRRFVPSVYCLAGRPADPARSCVPQLAEARVPVTYLGLKQPREFTTGLARLSQAWRRERPEIVQSFLYHANLLGRVAAWRAGVPHMVTGVRVAERRGRWRLRWDRWTDRLVERHVCVSQAVADFAVASGRLPRGKLVVIPNGVDTAAMREQVPADLAALGLPPGHRAAIVVGRLDPQKGLAPLLDRLPAVLDRAPRYHLLVVGDGRQAPELAQRAADLGLAGRVHFLGWRNDVPALLKASDLLVLPSLWEGMPNVVLEAMAAGLAVCAFDVEGVAEVLGATGERQVVAPVGNFAGLAEHLTYMLSRPGMLAHLGLANQRRAAAEFTWERMVSAYEALYESLVAGAAPSGHLTEPTRGGGGA